MICSSRFCKYKKRHVDKPSMRRALKKKKRQENLAHIEGSIHFYMKTLVNKMLSKTKHVRQENKQ